MSSFHIVAQLPNGHQKSVFNLSHEKALDTVVEFLRDGTLTTRWGNKTQTRQAYEFRVYETDEGYNKRTSGQFADFIKGKRNVFSRFQKEAESRVPKKRTRVFVVMPIQGERYGTQSQQAVLREYNERFEMIEKTLGEYDCVAIRIDKEAPLGGLVDRIKQEIRRAEFIVADLTDERPSCYFEVGYAEALHRPIVFVASRESVVNPGEETKIHFDIHQNVQFFVNHEELAEKLRHTIEANKPKLLEPADQAVTAGALLEAFSRSTFTIHSGSEIDPVE